MNACQNFIKEYKKVDPLSIREKYIAMTAWKAALEWIRVKVENYTPEDICYFINEELGVEDENL